MIEKSGKIFINNELNKYRYDKNENYGVDIGRSLVSFFEIVFEMCFKNYKITISRYKELPIHGGMRVAFDPPEVKKDTKNG